MAQGHRPIVCFLTVRPSASFLEFCGRLHPFYDVYVCVDDNTYRVPPQKHCRILQLSNAYCERHGFHNVLGYYRKRFRNTATARDKALCYFNKHMTRHQHHIWMLEEDVFVPRVDTLVHIDRKFPTGDLLCRQNQVYRSARETTAWRHWKHVYADSGLSFPYGRSMICAVRCSRRLIRLIGQHARTHGKLFVDESLFNTVALHNGLTIVTPAGTQAHRVSQGARVVAGQDPAVAPVSPHQGY